MRRGEEGKGEGKRRDEVRKRKKGERDEKKEKMIHRELNLGGSACCNLVYVHCKSYVQNHTKLN